VARQQDRKGERASDSAAVAGVKPGPGVARSPGHALQARPGFLADRAAERWDHGQPASDGDDVSRFIIRFSPAEVPPDVWARIEGSVRDWVRRVEPEPLERARNVMNAVTQLAVWADTLGHPLESEVLLRPETIDRFVVEGCRHLSHGTRTNYRTVLRAVGRKVLSPELFPPQPVFLPRSEREPPYTAAEIADFVSWARGLPTERMRGNAMALLSLGLGAGLTTREIARVIGTDVSSDSEGVLVAVTGQTARDVPVLRAWEEEVLSRAAEVGGRPYFLPDRTEIRRHHIPNFIEGCRRSHPAPRLSIQRLRITWIVTQIRSGTSLQSLAPYAAVQPEQLCGYLSFVDPEDPAETRRFIRDADGT
jgi:hypothetical protein